MHCILYLHTSVHLNCIQTVDMHNWDRAVSKRAMRKSNTYQLPVSRLGPNGNLVFLKHELFLDSGRADPFTPPKDMATVGQKTTIIKLLPSPRHSVQEVL